MERLHDAFLTQSSKSSAGIVESITREIQSFAGSAPQNDDITLIAIQKH